MPSASRNVVAGGRRPPERERRPPRRQRRNRDRRDRDNDEGRRPEVDTTQIGSVVFSGETLAEPNGVAIFGYANDEKKVLEFVQLLKKEKHFIKSGVYFHISSLLEVPGINLDTASIGALQSSARIRSSSFESGRSGDDNDSSRFGGRFRLNQSNFGSTLPNNRVSRGAANFSVVEFQIELQMYGKAFKFEDGDVRDE